MNEGAGGADVPQALFYVYIIKICNHLGKRAGILGSSSAEMKAT